MKKYLEKKQLNDYSIGVNSLLQNHGILSDYLEYQLGQYKCYSPAVFANRLQSPSPFRSVTPIQGQISPINQSRRESAFSRNSENFDFSVKEKSKIINNQSRQTAMQYDNIDMLFDREQIIIEEQETLHAKLRMIRDDYNFKVSQLEDQYLRERQSIMQNLRILIKEEQDRSEPMQHKKRKSKQMDLHARTDSLLKQDSRNDSQQKYQQEIVRAATSMKEQRPEQKFERREIRIDSRRESGHESQTGFSSHHRRESSHKSMRLRESRVKKDESIKCDSLKDDQPFLKSALKKKDSNRQTYNCNDDSQDDWKFIKEAKNNLEKQKTQLDDKQSPNKVRFVNNDKSAKKKDKDKIVKSKHINDIDVFLKCRY